MTQKKARLNLYLNRELLDFAKKWSYVADVPISRMLEEYLQQQQARLSGMSPFQWLTDRDHGPRVSEERDTDLEAYLSNREEQEFSRENPDHPRARLRRKLLAEFEQKKGRELEGQKQKEREFIARWLEVFPVK